MNGTAGLSEPRPGFAPTFAESPTRQSRYGDGAASAGGKGYAGPGRQGAGPFQCGVRNAEFGMNGTAR
jgi:hypothetical protein